MEKTKNWDFAEDDIHFMTHGIHMYPARMIPQIAENLIRNYGRNSKLLLDPFCGSGGVLVEAVRANIDCIGLDINPLACLISRIKSTPISPTRLSKEWENLHIIIRRQIESYRLKEFKPLMPFFGTNNIHYWFKPHILDELVLIKNIVDTIKNDKVRDFLYVCFSNTVRAVSGTRKGEFKLYRIPPHKWNAFNPDVFCTFTQKVELAISMMGQFYQYTKEKDIKANSNVFEVDTRNLLEGNLNSKLSNRLHEGSVDLIITSPPYGDSHTTVAYGQFSRYSLVILGYQYEKVSDIDKISLGGKKNDLSIKSVTLEKTLSQIRNHRRGLEVLYYFVDLAKCLTKLCLVLSNKGHACFVLGNRTVNGVKIPNDEILIELAKDLGLSNTKIIKRNIPSKRIPWKSSPTNIPGQTVRTISKESIVILNK